jgi:ABC-type amino acid transport system permease subunit
MYFIKYQQLKEQLRERTFTDRDGLPYYVLFVASTTFFIGVPTRTSSGIDVLSASISTAIVILGIIYSYKKNGGRTGHDFMQKTIVLGWIVFFRLLPFLVISVVVSVFIKKALGHPLGSKSWVNIVLSSAFMAIYYQRLGRHIKDTTRLTGEPVV